MLDLSFSSLEIDPSFAEYLGLTGSQITAIQRLMSQEHGDVETLKTHAKTGYPLWEYQFPTTFPSVLLSSYALDLITWKFCCA